MQTGKAGIQTFSDSTFECTRIIVEISTINRFSATITLLRDRKFLKPDLMPVKEIIAGKRPCRFLPVLVLDGGNRIDYNTIIMQKITTVMRTLLLLLVGAAGFEPATP